MASIPLRCELVAKKNHLAWKWTVAANWMIDDVVDIAEMAVGRDFVVYLTRSGQLLKCGSMPRRISYEKFRLQGKRRRRAHAIGAELKQLSVRERELYNGHVCDSNCSPLELPMTQKIRVRQVSCGATHCMVLGEVDTVDGVNVELFAWGLGEYGQLGLGNCQASSNMTSVTESIELHALLQNLNECHVVLRCGVFSTYLFVRGSSILWHWGLLPSADHDSRFVRQGVPVKFPLLDENTRLVDVAVGLEHVVLLTEDGCVFTWGYGNSGQLGLGPLITSNVDCQYLTKVDFFRHEANHCIVAVSCGWNHSLAVSRNGDVYSWGSNAYGACGTKSKFCAYFQPVIVAVPRPVELGLTSPNVQAQICCGGNSSALLLRHVSDKYCATTRTFMWGVNSPEIAILLPIEVLSCGDKQIFTDCCMGLGRSIWLLRTGNESSKQELVPAWIVKEVGAQAGTRQGFAKELPCLYVDDGTKIRIQVEAISKAAVDAISTLSENGGENANGLFELALEQDRPALSPDENCFSSVSIFSVMRNTQGNPADIHATVEITILVQVKQRAVISITSSIGEVIGQKFVVDIAPQNDCDSMGFETTADENGNQRNSIYILGIHVEGTVAERQERVDTKWYKLNSKRIRVHSDDAVIVLIESATTDIDPVIQVEFRDNHWQYGLTHLDVTGGDDNSRSHNLSVVQLRFLSPGQYFIYDTKSLEDECDHRTPLLIVHCCTNTQERTRILTENHDLVWSKYQSALMNAPPPAQFSLFLSSILQHSILRDAVVCSPWTTTCNEECCEPSLDFDREGDAQDVCTHHPEHPFILWKPYLTSPYTLDFIHHLAEDANSLSLNAILPDWAEALSSKVAFRIAKWLEKPYAGSNKNNEELPNDYEEARLKAVTTGVSVLQIPYDFLGSVSLMNQRSVRDALRPINPNIMGVHDLIVAWRRTNGDLFYTVQSNELLVQRYGHESHDFPETAQSGRITRLKSQLSDFLWQAAEGKKLEDIFQLLTSPIKQDMMVPEDGSKASIGNVIHLRELIFHTTALGFDEVVAIPKQEWFALFRGIQPLSPSNSTGIAFDIFRTLLIDPFHQFFWKQYVHQIREQANSNREMITRALAESFEVSERVAFDLTRNKNSENSNNDEELVIPWSDFVESLRSFHSILGLKPLPPSDCCRLLYRFDARGNGRISTEAYRKTLLHTLDEIDAATKVYDFTKTQPNKVLKGKHLLKIAIANDHRRPNVELFTSNEAVHKLFTARAKPVKNLKSQRMPTKDAFKSTCTITSRANYTAAALRASANTRLARIRNLPISQLLREGIYFRPPRETLYRYQDEQDNTQALSMGAEDSF